MRAAQRWAFKVTQFVAWLRVYRPHFDTTSICVNSIIAIVVVAVVIASTNLLLCCVVIVFICGCYILLGANHICFKSFADFALFTPACGNDSLPPFLQLICCPAQTRTHSVWKSENSLRLALNLKARQRHRMISFIRFSLWLLFVQ